MAKQLQKLELTWIGKGDEPKLEPRILIEDPTKSYGNPKTENMLINGDNLLALRALESDYSGGIKCVYIDPPYNTGNAFKHYDDGIEHSEWLNLMKPRIDIIHKLLSDDGSLWVSIDDDECHYLKVLLDQVFGRHNFLTNIVWQKKYGASNDAKWFSDTHDHILVYAKNKNVWKPNLLPRPKELDGKYSNPDNDERGDWISTNLSVKTFSEKNYYPITSPKGITFLPPPTRCWVVSEEKYNELLKDNRIWFGKNGDARPYKKTFLSEVQQGIVPITWWAHSEAGHNIEAKSELRKLFGDNMDLFATPKPERLIQRIIHIATKENDFVLDSFLGSGTTASVAHKMKRRWIGIELGEHATTHCFPRLKKVIDGADSGGITEAVGWTGGGGFKFYTLAPTLIKTDKYGNDIINPDFNPDMLAAAMAKQEGFHYQPHESIYWKQGYSSEKDYIFTTTQFITVELIDKLAEELQPTESLLLCCKGFKSECKKRHSNITIKKIPQMLYGRCEFGKDDYSFNIINIPNENADNYVEEPKPEYIKQTSTPKLKKKKEDDNQPSLF